MKSLERRIDTKAAPKACIECKQLYHKGYTTSANAWEHRSKTCSTTCRSRYTSRLNSGGNAGAFSKARLTDKTKHPRWLGGISSRPGYSTPYKRAYKLRKRGAFGTFSGREWFALLVAYQHKCLSCGSKAQLEADHVIPLACGGPNIISNIQPLCRTCNARKGATIIDFRTI